MDVKIDLPEGGADDNPVPPDDLRIDYENIVSRHRKFTVEFERTLAICVDQFKNLVQKANRREQLVRCFNSVFNNTTTIEQLEDFKKNYIQCQHCAGVSHCQVEGTTQPFRTSAEARPSEIERQATEQTRQKALCTFINQNTRMRNTLPDIFVHPTQNIVHRFRERHQQKKLSKLKADYIEVDSGSSLSDYIIYMVRGRTEEQSFLTILMDITNEVISHFQNHILPLVRIFSVSIMITALQWILYIVRVIHSHNNASTSEVAENVTFGAFSGTLLKSDIAVYRIFSSTFFHNSGAHLVIGTIMHFRFSSVFERIHGAATTLVMYFLTSAYGMVGICGFMPNELQANGFAGDWGMAGALVSRYFIFPYLIDRERQHIINGFVSMICLLFVKTIKAESSILVSTHLLSALAGFCLGIMINSRLGKGRCCGFPNLLVDFLCSFTLLSVPIASIFVLSLGMPA